MIAANNVLNAAFIVTGAGAIAGLTGFGMGPVAVLTIAAALNLAAAGLLQWAQPSGLLHAGRA